MRKVTLDRPFTAGMVTDQPAYKIGPQNSAYAQDLIAPEGIARQRKGWAYSGTTADVADNLVGVYRNKFILNDNTRTVTGDDDGDLFIHQAAGVGTALFSGTVQTLPRCVYRDELILCVQDGETPLIRYSGASVASNTYSGTPALVANQATVTGQTTTGTPESGSYFSPQQTTAAARLRTWHRILEASTTSATLENVVAAGGESLTGGGGSRFDGYGFAFPAVPIYGAGTVVFTNGTSNLDGFGTKWSTGGTTIRATSATGADGVLIIPSGADAQMFEIITVTDDDDIQAAGGIGADVAKSPYQITRRLPFKDAAAHKGSLWGTGVAQYPNTVYVGPPGWDISVPPGYILPFSPASTWSSPNANDYLMDSIAVPSSYDGDVNVAILSSPSPLLVLKRSAVYGIYGAFPNFSVDKIEDGAGCIDLRSAVSTANGQFWAGEHGIYVYVGGQVVDLTRGKINREWRALTRDFDFGTLDYCTIGQVYDHLFVSIVTGSGATDRCYVYDMANQSWASRFTNHKSRYFFSAQVDGEAEELYWVGDNDQGRIMKSAVAVNGTGIAKDGDGTSPEMIAWTGEGLDGTQTLDDDERLLDLAISHNVYDAGAAGSTVLGVSVVSGGSLEAQATATKTLTAIDSDDTDRVDRTRFREVNAKGRQLQVRLDVTTLGSNNGTTKIEVPEMTATLRDRRSRT